jgi:hypothetical protein
LRETIIHRGAAGIFAAAACILALSCATARHPASVPPPGPALAAAPAAARPPYPSARFVVISDPHVYDAGLGISGAAFERATAGSRILYGLSAELFHEAIGRTLALRPDFVLLPGDLTKDGEPSSHAIVESELARLKGEGIRAYVIPGNHDLLNPRALRFKGGKAERLETLSPRSFAVLYADYGYSGSLSRDPASLSYVAELLPGLRLLALDSFKYPARPDPAKPEPSSAFGRKTMAWIASSLEEADRSGDAVIAMMHQSVLEHFEGQAKYFPDTFARERDELAALLASHNVHLVFTGHFHIEDIALGRFPSGETLYDVATGSLAGYPMPFRVVELGGGATTDPHPFASIRTERIDAIPSMPDGLGPFAKDFLESRMSGILETRLEAYLVPRREAKAIAGSYTEAYIALSEGDEDPGLGHESFPLDIRSLMGRLAESRYAKLLKSLWRDLPPADNDLQIDLGDY